MLKEYEWIYCCDIVVLGVDLWNNSSKSIENRSNCQYKTRFDSTSSLRGLEKEGTMKIAIASIWCLPPLLL
jgi:hypothetical protein